MNLREILNTASYVVTIVGPMIRIVSPGSEVANKLADMLEQAQSVLRFGNKVLDEHLPELAEAFAEIKAEVDLLAEQGEHVPADRWDAVSEKIDNSVARVKKAMGL